jgi:glycerophosphoryl diester phosphodiesterase
VRVLAVAHRAGNDLEQLRAAVELGADVVEADVHRHRGRLEVRHLKSMGPVPYLWDRWYLVPKSVRQLQLAELLDAVGPVAGRATLMVDLKGVGGVGAAVARALHERVPDAPVLVCSRWWPSVEPFAGSPWARPLLTARGTTELSRLRRRLRTRPPYGVSVHRSLLTAPVVAELRARVPLVMTWPVNDEAALEHVLRLGVTGVISDEAAVLRAVVGERTP